MNNIKIEVDKTLTSLAGNKYGHMVYDNQVKDRIDFDKVTIIEFPSQICIIATSFIQGFFEGIIKNIGLEGLEQKIEIKSSIPNLKEKIINNLL